MKSKILLVDHGSRNPRAHKEFSDLIEKLKPEFSGVPVSLCHMEIADPLLEEQLINDWEAGFQEFWVFPLFFFNGKHLVKDIPAILARFELLHPEAKLHLQDAIGRLDSFAEFLNQEIESKIK